MRIPRTALKYERTAGQIAEKNLGLLIREGIEGTCVPGFEK